MCIVYVTCVHKNTCVSCILYPSMLCIVCIVRICVCVCVCACVCVCVCAYVFTYVCHAIYQSDTGVQQKVLFFDTAPSPHPLKYNVERVLIFARELSKKK